MKLEESVFFVRYKKESYHYFFVLGMGGTHFLPELVGPAVAADLLLTGRTVTAEELLELKIVSKVTQTNICNSEQFKNLSNSTVLFQTGIAYVSLRPC